MKKRHIIWLAFLLIALIMIIIFSFRNESNIVKTNMLESMMIQEDERLQKTRADEKNSYTGGTEIQLTDVEAKITGKGAMDKDSDVIINQAGDYLISGKLQDGKIIVSADDDEVVHLFFNGVEIYSKDGPALYVQSAHKVIVTLVDGQINTLIDGSVNDSYSTATACIYSNADLTFNGNGSINVWGYYEDAIVSKGIIKVLSGDYSMSAIDDGIRGRDGVYIENGTFYIQTEGTGIKSTHTSNESKGFVEICGGTFNIISGEHAISAIQKIEVNHCNMTINTVLDAFSCQNLIGIEEGCINNG